jgi:acyl-CoA synthetase (AMP-forming)/AMP-acid ligase II
MVPSHVIARAELPRSPNNKFDRNLLRQELAA